MESGTIPWRGPGPDRPELPLPPGPMPLRRDGQLRKRWRYVGVFAEELMLCAASAEVGPLRQSFWALWDRGARRADERTILRPGSHQVRIEGPRLEIDSPGLRASLLLGEAIPIETICPSGSAWAWTRKRAGVPVSGTVEVPGRRWTLDGSDALAVDDESAGYHARRTSWHWSAGVGHAADGRALAWNLVEGINDPPRGSERAVWVDGEPHEPAPVRFDDVEAVEFADGSRLAFAAESERAHDENFLLIRSRYSHRFGRFSGALNGIELGAGLGVVERHQALW
jgi:hypothetical protein